MDNGGVERFRFRGLDPSFSGEWLRPCLILTSSLSNPRKCIFRDSGSNRLTSRDSLSWRSSSCFKVSEILPKEGGSSLHDCKVWNRTRLSKVVYVMGAIAQPYKEGGQTANATSKIMYEKKVVASFKALGYVGLSYIGLRSQETY